MQKSRRRSRHDGANIKTDILEPADVSASSFYYQFADKTDLLLEIFVTPPCSAGRRSSVRA
jgi:hypothetical protein